MSYQYDNIPGLPPFLGAVVTIGSFLLAIFLPELNILLHYQIPPIFIQGFQIFAYSGTGIVGVITGYKFYKESIKPKFKNRKIKK